MEYCFYTGKYQPRQGIQELFALGRMSPPDGVTVYVCLTPNEYRSLFTRKFPKENAVLLSLDSLADSELKEFEEGDLVSRVEYYYGSLPVLTRYWCKLTALKWAHTIWNGVDGLTKTIDAHEPKPKFLLTRTLGSVNAVPVSEYVIGQIIARERNFSKLNNLQVKSLRDRIRIQSSEKNLCAMTIGLLGVGGIGKEVARVCKTFGMTVWGFTKRTVTTETACPHVDKYVTKERLPELLQHCDYICCILPDTPDTDDLLSGDILSHCKNKKSVLINVGRGNVIDEATIVKAINEGWLCGAILDVFRSEPLPPSSPLWSLPGVTITPHISGWTWGNDHLNKLHSCFLENYRRYIEGAPLLGVVDWERGY